MVDYVPPPAKNKLPMLESDFANNEEKGKFVNELIAVATAAMNDGDAQYNQFIYNQAHSEYLVSLDGFMHLMKITKDDANFQAYLRQKMTYLLDRGEKCKKNI